MAYTTIDDPSEYFQTAIWTGTGSSQTITNDGNSNLKPDWIWIKCRSNARDHVLLDSTRGGTKALVSNTDGAEATDGAITSFNTDGFTHGGQNAYGGNGETHVGWQWKCNGGTKADNNDGSITVNLQVNQAAGFSIGTYTGTGSQLTLGHGLGAVPKLHITKKLNAADAWNVYHESIGNTHGLRLNNTDAKEDFGFYGDTSPTSSVFTVGGVTDNDRLNTNGGSYVFYSFAEKQGYSKFGSYKGNGNADGTFVYTGFKPAFVIVKSSSEQADWELSDNKRTTSGGNVIDKEVRPNTNAAETGGTDGRYIDYYSNGFKLRQGFGNWNGSNGTYIYMAFAEAPLVGSNNTPCTAR